MNGMSFRHAGTLDDSPGVRVEIWQTDFSTWAPPGMAFFV
jgi:hypothetical protein